MRHCCSCNIKLHLELADKFFICRRDNEKNFLEPIALCKFVAPVQCQSGTPRGRCLGLRALWSPSNSNCFHGLRILAIGWVAFTSCNRQVRGRVKLHVAWRFLAHCGPSLHLWRSHREGRNKQRARLTPRCWAILGHLMYCTHLKNQKLSHKN